MASAPSRLNFGVAELVRVQILGILTNSATPKLSLDEPLGIAHPIALLDPCRLVRQVKEFYG